MLQINTTRLRLLPFTKEICEAVMAGSAPVFHNLKIKPAQGWPDAETLDTLPRILNNLRKVAYPSGFESWMILHKDTYLLIGDIGFKGLPNQHGEIDIGYGIIANERQKGYAKEAAVGLIEWAFGHAEIKTITASSLKSNEASRNVLTFLKFTEIGADEEMIYWRLSK